jgi:hypothetical protein
MFEENVLLRGDEAANPKGGDESGIDVGEGAGYPNISSSGGFVIKLGS